MKYIEFLDCRYCYDNECNIYSVFGPEGLRDTPVLIKPKLREGYMKYTFTLDNGKKLNTSIHRVLAFSLQGGDFSNKKLVVNHKDGNKLNNNPDNLSIGTPKENSEHAAKLGLYDKKCSFTKEEKQKLLESKAKELGLM